MAIRDLFRRKQSAQPAPQRKTSATGPVVAYHSSGRVVWSARDTVSLTKSGYCGNPVGFRAVKLIAEAAAAVPLILQDSDTRYSDHPILRLINSPNAAQTQADFLESLYGQLLLSGDAYVEMVAGADDIATELHVLRSDRMSLVPGADGWPVAYEYTVGGRKHRFTMGDGVDPICHIRNFHPQDDHYGFSPLQAAAQALDVHNAATQWSKALLDNAAPPIVETGNFAQHVPALPVRSVFIDAPNVAADDGESAPYIAVTADPWSGPVAVYGSDGGTDFVQELLLSTRNVIGQTLTPIVAKTSAV